VQLKEKASVNCYVLGLALYPAVKRAAGHRLEEMVYHTSHAALDHAGIHRRELDHVTLGACDELDGRSISSMLMAMPAGAYMVDEIKVTDSAASALCLEVARLKSEEFDIGLVASWCKSSKTDVESVMRLRGEPFYTRPFGLDMGMSEAMLAQAVAEEFGVSAEQANERVIKAYARASANPRGLSQAVPTLAEVAASPYEATPLRAMHRAPLSDGAVCMVVASERWLARHPQHRPLARIAGVGWAADSYRLDRARLRDFNSARKAWAQALRMSGLPDASSIDVMELETPTVYHEAAYEQVLGLDASTQISPSGGAFAQNPLFCTGLVGAAEAVLQVAGQAGAVQVPGVRRAAAHSCHGYAQQGNVFMIFEGAAHD
jgi:acetyl-CoA acetyltransferase